MRIDRFGADFDTAYQFSQYLMEDSWAFSRPPMYDRVGGLPGVFDYYGDDNFPYEPFTITKKMYLMGDGTFAGVEAAIDALKAATIAVDESKLWILRPNDTSYWFWAKCTSLNIADSFRNYTWLPVTIEFFCREGAWYTAWTP
jgi:hypothetical protein